MKFLKTIASLLLILPSFFGNGQVENVDWVSFSDSTSSSISEIAIDNENNIVGTGHFLELSIQGKNLTACCGNDHNVFVVKWDSFGNVLWMRSIKTGGGFTNSITTDSDNNIIVTAEFIEKLTINGEEFISDSVLDEFVIKYDANGNVLWAKHVIIQNGWTPMPVKTDANDNIYFITRGKSEIDGVVTDAKTVLTKLNSNGDLEWSLPFDIELGSGSQPLNLPMAINSKNEILLYGLLLGETTFGGVEYSIRDSLPVFMIAKISENGEALNAVTAASTWLPYPSSITLNDEDEIFISAGYYGEIDLGDIHLIDEYKHGFLAKLDADLNFITAQNTYGFPVYGAVTNDAGTYLTGHRGLMLFIERYDDNCELIEELRIGEENTNIEYGRSLASFDNNEIVVSGSYASSFNVGEFDLYANPFEYGHRGLLIKFGCSLSSTDEDCERKFEFSLYPNPIIGQILNATFEKEFGLKKYEIYDFTGKLIDQQTGYEGELEVQIDLSELNAGGYIIKLTGAESELVERFIRL